MHMNTVERFHVYNTDKNGLHMNEIYANNSNPIYNNNNNNNPWCYSSDKPGPAEQPPLAVFPDCTR
jgi:hypothetical protein